MVTVCSIISFPEKTYVEKKSKTAEKQEQSYCVHPTIVSDN